MNVYLSNPGDLSDALNILSWFLDKAPIQGVDFKLKSISLHGTVLSEESSLSDYISSPH